MYDAISHLVYVARGDDVLTTVVNGRVLMDDRRVLSLDRAAVLSEANRLAATVMDAIR
jgi:5-methylthioadenosine/S-adenosylhomocysteine deaminase